MPEVTELLNPGMSDHFVVGESYYRVVNLREWDRNARGCDPRSTVGQQRAVWSKNQGALISWDPYTLITTPTSVFLLTSNLLKLVS